VSITVGILAGIILGAGLLKYCLCRKKRNYFPPGMFVWILLSVSRVRYFTQEHKNNNDKHGNDIQGLCKSVYFILLRETKGKWSTTARRLRHTNNRNEQARGHNLCRVWVLRSSLRLSASVSTYNCLHRYVHVTCLHWMSMLTSLPISFPVRRLCLAFVCRC